MAITTGSADQVVQPVPGGFRAMTVIHDSSAPSSYSYTFAGSAVGSLVSHPSGAIEIRDTAGESVGLIDAPWARDANGKDLPTAYAVDGTTLTQTVDLSGAAYPVTIDPRVTLGWFIYIRWNKNEVRGNWGRYQSGVANLGPATCGFVPGPYNIACAAVAATYMVSIRDTWRYAANNRRCMEYRVNYSPQVVVGWKSYSC